MRMLLFAALALIPLAGGCGKKAPPEAPAEAEPTFTVQMPDTPMARRFAQRLVDTPITDWEVLGGAGATLIYRQFTFASDGHWNADAVLQADFEEIGCKESGVWRIEDVQTADTAIMEWDLSKSNCPTREPGSTTRVQLSLLRDGGYKIAFH